MLPLLIFSSQFSEPTRDFYIAISPMYSIWIIFTLVFLPIEKFGYWLWVYLSKKFKLKSSVIQRELEAAMRRKDFDYYHKIPYLMGILTVVMYFSGGMPFLIIMFSPFMLIYFWIEKLMLLKFYRKPKNLDATTLRIADYVILGILIIHIFSAIIMFGTSNVFPVNTKQVTGVRKGYITQYYNASKISFFAKFWVVTNIPYLIMLVLCIIFISLTYCNRNKVWWRKFNYFPMSYSVKYKFIPATYGRMKAIKVIGETSYNMADIDKYREALATFDMSKINDEAFKVSYSQLFQTSNGPVDTLSKLNLSSQPDNRDESFHK